jgi:hypothetical protein
MHESFLGEIHLNSSMPLHLLVDYRRIDPNFSTSRRVDQAPDSKQLLVVELK